MDLRGQSIASLRERCRALTHASDGEPWLSALREDPRVGVQNLATSLERRIAAERAEAKRLDGLFARQRALHAQGVRAVAGVDEVGVGPLAGPVVAAAVILPAGAALPGLNDSKMVKPADRERLDREIRACAEAVGVSVVSPREIDEHNIYRASLLAMRRAVEGLEGRAGHLLVDARSVPGVRTPQTAIVGGDGREASIAAASIVAKVTRDRIMASLDLQLPDYGFARHKGYGTAFHLEMLKIHGPSPHHRSSFAPVRKALSTTAR